MTHCTKIKFKINVRLCDLVIYGDIMGVFLIIQLLSTLLTLSLDLTQYTTNPG